MSGNPLAGSTLQNPWELDSNGDLVLASDINMTAQESVVRSAREQVLNLPPSSSRVIAEDAPAAPARVPFGRLSTGSHLAARHNRHHDPEFGSLRLEAQLQVLRNEEIELYRSLRRQLRDMHRYSQAVRNGAGTSRIVRPEPVLRTAQKENVRLPRVGPPIAHNDLYLDFARPPSNPEIKVKPHHTCTICQGLKSHPVTVKCGHSYCYVCIRLWLEKKWSCPECMATITCRPFRHYPEEAGLA
ncbi:hypothetical protein B0H16DRAFT_1746641 [Mycena metata]|uniref:RING-type domain-containing protein n=1 Tax=Mycena metata TaxID=1033252 RepID=A0AAD7GX69_9AGAR|nr:hypothetical protein B0H16DRAFT_1746641 [Mycena metata]